MAVIAAAPRLAGNSRVMTFNTTLQQRAQVQDIYTYKSGVYNRENKSFPMDTIKLRVKDQTVTSNRITLLENLREPGVYGNDPAWGTEEPPRTKDYTTYQNNYRKVIPKPGYGLRQLEAEKYKLYQQHETNMGLWAQEEEGYSIRHAILERYSPNIDYGDLAGETTEWWNPNTFIPGLDIYSQPAFDVDRAVHTQNICNGWVATGGFGQSMNRILRARVLEDVSNWALHKRMWPLKIPGLPTGEGFVLTVSELVASMLASPTYVADNLGALYVQQNRFTNEELMKWPGVIGYYNNILIVCDPRQPTVLPSGSSVYSMQAGYMVWDSRDLRHRQSNFCKEAAFLLGLATFWEVEGQKVHWIADQRDYEFHKGLGIAGVRGQGLPIFVDQDTNEAVYQGGGVVFLDLPNHGRIAA